MGLGDRANLVDFVKENKVPALFVESSVNPAALEEVAKETGTKIGRPLFSDALGPADQELLPTEKYLLSSWSGMMVHNAAIVDGLTKTENEQSHKPLEVHDLTVSYQRKPVLYGIDFEIEEGSLWA